MSDCLTLCKGCHAREHDLIEPTSGWVLVSIEDLGDLVGTCERKGCGNEIRYAHHTYHPKWGYKIVGSTCIEHLTSEDQTISKDYRKVLDKASQFLKNSYWEHGITEGGKSFVFTKHSHHIVRVYGSDNSYAYQVAIKEKGMKKMEYKDVYQAKSRTLEQTKELGYYLLKGLTTEDENERNILRQIYKNIR